MTTRRDFLKKAVAASICAVAPALALRVDEPEFKRVSGFVRASDYPPMMNSQGEIGRYEGFSYYGADVADVEVKYTNGKINARKIKFRKYYKLPPEITHYRMG